MARGSVPTTRDSGRRGWRGCQRICSLLIPLLNPSWGPPLPVLLIKCLLKMFLENGSILQTTSSTTKTATLKPQPHTGGMPQFVTERVFYFLSPPPAEVCGTARGDGGRGKMSVLCGECYTYLTQDLAMEDNI